MSSGLPVQSLAALAQRRVTPELLDVLPETDPRAIRSRRDLRRVNAWMGNARILAKLLNALQWDRSPRTVVELGAGDGSLSLAIARLLQPSWKNVELTLVDRLRVVQPGTLHALRELGWRASLAQADVFHWLERSAPVDVVIANLFLHHFEVNQLERLFVQLQRVARVFAACEPKRFSFPRLAGGLVRLIGCNSVTRHDAIVSIGAGFRGEELSTLWANDGSWKVQEGAVGLFSHRFFCERPLEETKLAKQRKQQANG